MRYILTGLCLVVLAGVVGWYGCDMVSSIVPPSFELKKGGYGFGGDRSGDCIILTSDDFWVDRTEIGNLIDMQGGHCLTIDPWKVMFVIPDSINADSFIKALRPKIADIGGKIKAGWNTSKIEKYMEKKYGKENG